MPINAIQQKVISGEIIKQSQNNSYGALINSIDAAASRLEYLRGDEFISEINNLKCPACDKLIRTEMSIIDQNSETISVSFSTIEKEKRFFEKVTVSLINQETKEEEIIKIFNNTKSENFSFEAPKKPGNYLIIIHGEGKDGGWLHGNMPFTISE